MRHILYSDGVSSLPQAVEIGTPRSRYSASFFFHTFAQR